MKGRRAIKQLATKKGQRAKDMLVMAEFNDPFYVGSNTQCKSAEWVRELYLLLRPKHTVHIRRLHYFALTQPQHRKPNGCIYANTEANWKFLKCACKFVDDQLKSYLDLPKITRAARIANNAMAQISDQIEAVIEKNANLDVVFRTVEKLLAQSSLMTDCNADGPWLLDSHRDYMTQLAAYHLHRLR